MKDYKKKYYRALAAVWFMFFVSLFVSWNIHNTLDEIHEEIVEMEKRKEHELIQAYHDAGWLPYDAVKEEEGE